MRRVAARYALDAMVAREPICSWIIDDTGFLKQGTHSVGVQRQYTGTAGKIANCQIGVSLSVATKTEHVPIDFELYLPQAWAEDPARRRKARIPDEVVFETKPQLALNMVRWAVEDGLPKGVLLADSAYGDSTAFREGMRGLGLDYAVGVHGPTKVWRLDKRLRRRGEPIGVEQLALSLGRSRFRRFTWREGSKQPLWSRFACEQPHAG